MEIFMKGMRSYEHPHDPWHGQLPKLYAKEKKLAVYKYAFGTVPTHQ
jgi:hypothetical protein